MTLQSQSIELHDSAIERITIENGAAVVYFSHAYIHMSEGRPGIDAGTGWSQAARLHIAAAEINGALPASHGGDVYYLSGGRIELNGIQMENELPVPLDVQGTVNLELECWGETIRFKGSGAKLELLGAPDYIEEFKP